MAEDLMKPDGKRAENSSLQLHKVLEEELDQYFGQLDAMLLELEKDRKN